jgi:hypothetical protein
MRAARRRWVAWRLWSYTVVQQRPASEMKPGETPPALGIVSAAMEPNLALLGSTFRLPRAWPLGTSRPSDTPERDNSGSAHEAIARLLHGGQR